MENFHLIYLGFRQNQMRSHLGGLAHFLYEQIIFLYEFFKEGEISLRWARPLKRAKQMLNNTLRLNIWFSKIIHVLDPGYLPRIIGHVLKNKQNNKYVCNHEIKRLTIKKRNMKRKNRSHRCDINKPRSRHEHKYSKYKKCLTIVMLICINQHLSNTWSSNHEKVMQDCGRIEKNVLLLRKSM